MSGFMFASVMNPDIGAFMMYVDFPVMWFMEYISRRRCFSACAFLSVLSACNRSRSEAILPLYMSCIADFSRLAVIICRSASFICFS